MSPLVASKRSSAESGGALIREGFSGFQIAVFTEHKTRKPCRNARIALARAGSSENNNTLNPKPKKVERSQPEMLIRTTVKLSILIDGRGRLREIGGTKFEAKRPWQDPYSHGRGQKHKTSLRISYASGPRARRISGGKPNLNNLKSMDSVDQANSRTSVAA